MKINSFQMWMLATALVGGTFMFTQITPSETAKASSQPFYKILHEQSISELNRIKASSPFKVLIPKNNVLSERYLISAKMGNVVEGTDLVHIDFFYKTPLGEVHLWETNASQELEKNPFSVPGLKTQEIIINNKVWEFCVHPEDKKLLIFTSVLNGNLVQVSGNVPYRDLYKYVSLLQ